MAYGDRGYGRQHRIERERWRPLVEAGQALCARCGHPIDPDGPWDLGHADGSRTEYNGPEHVRCNRRVGGRNGGRQKARRQRAVRAATWTEPWL